MFVVSERFGCLLNLLKYRGFYISNEESKYLEDLNRRSTYVQKLHMYSNTPGDEILDPDAKNLIKSDAF